MRLTISSIAFAHNAETPSLYTCEGKDISPPLAWSGAPAGTKSLALIVDDPDAPDPPPQNDLVALGARCARWRAAGALSRGAIAPHPRAPAGFRAIPAHPPCVRRIAAQ